jgi:hypothetical protein
MQALINDAKDKIPDVVAEIEKKEVIIKVSDISRNGVFKIKFNQELIIPDFLDHGSTKSAAGKEGRNLVPLEQIDV